MKISLITACFNSASVISHAMDTILSQTYNDVEYIVVDGGSTDGTVDVIKEYESKFDGKIRWVSEADQGLYDALNKGIRMATGDVVGILNADDFFRHEKVLEEVAKTFDDDIDAVYADIRFVKGEKLDQVTRYYSAKRWKPWMLRWGYMPPHPTFYCRRAKFDELGFYKLDYKIAADYELLIRFLWKGGLRTRYINDALIDMRLGGMSTTGVDSTITLNREIARGNRENGVYTNMLMLCFKYVFKVWELKQLRFFRKNNG
ncbi:MAG: glycosyltransferase family 2 protein [Kiritimatiellae bacterium]|jgi:glycosyltransferase involved in cell wall biosynthesis|nr:glycosyltransferase family 2 protein [Kiritimatiellia bacterium]